MAHYTILNSDNEVIDVITGVDEDDKSTLPSEFSSWEEFYKDQFKASDCKRTSYNTSAGEHALGGTAFRGNYAGIGWTYDPSNDVFIDPKRYDSWILDETTWLHKAPKDYPTDGKPYDWDEDSGDWVESS